LKSVRFAAQHIERLLTNGPSRPQQRHGSRRRHD
jgi:hypothetical protein